MNQTSISDRAEPEISDLLAGVVAESLSEAAITPRTRLQVIDLLVFPRLPLDRSSYEWTEVGPGLKLHVISQDPARSVKRCLVWGSPGAKTQRHGHTGDEVILVVEGRLQDDRGEYGPGEICRSSAGDVHQEKVMGETDCVCFVVYYGDLVPV
jgi:putative transcriptional regulator